MLLPPWMYPHVRWLRRLKRGIFNREEEAQLRAALAALKAFPSISQRRKSNLPAELIVSLTSYPARFSAAVATIKSLLDQTIDARLMLWVANSDFDFIPEELWQLTKFGLEIRGCSDLRSYKKIIPALQAFPDAYIVTADDDLYYPPSWLERICEAVQPNLLEIVGARGHIAKFQVDGRAIRYDQWEQQTSRTEASGTGERLFLTGVGGILYPPGSLHPQVTNEAVFSDICPYADDVWLFCMAEMQGTPRRRVSGQLMLTYWPDSQLSALRVHNVIKGGNDRQLAAVQRHYDLMFDTTQTETVESNS